MAERCPTCGGAVEVVSGDEGTSHYRPENQRLRQALEALWDVVLNDVPCAATGESRCCPKCKRVYAEVRAALAHRDKEEDDER